MNEIQNVQLELLKEFDKVCRKLNIKYYLYGGTLLGCIRHKGFIPWDDDLDVVMNRNDYDVFIKKGQKMLPQHLFIQTIDTDTKYTHGFAKLRNSNTTFIETTSKNLNINHGIYMDIFVLDNYKKNFLRDQVYKIEFLLIKYQLMKYYYLPNDNRILVKLVKLISNIFYGKLDNRKLIEKQIKISTRFKNEDCNYVQPYLDSNVMVNSRIYQKNWFGEGKTKDFENIKITVPVEYEKVLTLCYGDWRKLPPKEQQIGHHYTEVIDLNKSYKEYMQKK